MGRARRSRSHFGSLEVKALALGLAFFLVAAQLGKSARLFDHRVGRHRLLARSFLGLGNGAQRLVERARVPFGGEERVGLGGEIAHHAVQLAARHGRAEETFSDMPPAEEQRLAAAAERLVVEPEHAEKLLLRNAAEKARQDCFVDGTALAVEKRVVLSFAPHDVDRYAVRSAQRPPDAQLGHPMHVRVGGVAGDAVEESGDRAKRGALAGFVPAVDDVNVGRPKTRSSSTLVNGPNARRRSSYEPQCPSAASKRGMSMASTSATISASRASSRTSGVVPFAQLEGQVVR